MDKEFEISWKITGIHYIKAKDEDEALEKWNDISDEEFIGSAEELEHYDVEISEVEE